MSEADREGLRIARLFRQVRVGTNVRCCDLRQICDEDDLEILSSDVPEPGCVAYLLRRHDCAGGLIITQPGQEQGRWRFSVAHELGHYHIPKHRHIAGACAERDMRTRSTDSRRHEWEANDFATELLMPRRLFSEDAAKLDVSIASATKLAAVDHYNVSIMAAAWRIVQTTRQAAAMVVATDGRVDWVFRSNVFGVPLGERGQALHPDTIAAAAFRGREPSPDPCEVDSRVWLGTQESVSGTLLESTHFIPSLGQSVSMLWLLDADREVGEAAE